MARRHTKKHSRRHRRRHHRGGMAPVDYDLFGGWSSKMSLGQGEDYFKYHEGQHGGRRRRRATHRRRRHMGGSAPFPSAVSGSPLIDQNMVGPAMQTGPLRAYADVSGLTDAPDTVTMTTTQQGGRRRHRRRGHKSKKHCGGRHKRGRTCKHCRNHKCCCRKTKRRRHSRRHSRRHYGGGGFVGAPVNSPGMLLPSRTAYDQAGLNPGYRGSATEYAIAEQRDAIRGQ